jgi:plastocyanin
LPFYVAGAAAVVGLAVWGVSLRRTAADTGTAQALAGGTAAPSAAMTGVGSRAKVSVDNFVFEPKELFVTAGTTVTWVNADDVPHTATSKDSPPLFDSKTLHPGDRFSFELKTPGTYDYFCKTHPYMTGKVIVK